jgi:hypothetical protein
MAVVRSVFIAIGHTRTSSMPDYTPYQKKIIERYYHNFDAIKHQQLSELATEIYLAEGEKKRDRLWKRVEDSLRRLEFPEARIAHLLDRREPSLLVAILDELAKRSPGKS